MLLDGLAQALLFLYRHALLAGKREHGKAR
jgi:hypothetical protein